MSPTKPWDWTCDEPTTAEQYVRAYGARDETYGYCTACGDGANSKHATDEGAHLPDCPAVVALQRMLDAARAERL